MEPGDKTEAAPRVGSEGGLEGGLGHIQTLPPFNCNALLSLDELDLGSINRPYRPRRAQSLREVMGGRSAVT